MLVRSGTILVTYPAAVVAPGLGEEGPKPLVASLYGEPACGVTGVRLADGTRIRWRRGEWTVSPKREVRFSANSL